MLEANTVWDHSWKKHSEITITSSQVATPTAWFHAYFLWHVYGSSISPVHFSFMYILYWNTSLEDVHGQSKMQQTAELPTATQKKPRNKSGSGADKGTVSLSMEMWTNRAACETQTALLISSEILLSFRTQFIVIGQWWDFQPYNWKSKWMCAWSWGWMLNQS